MATPGAAPSKAAAVWSLLLFLNNRTLPNALAQTIGGGDTDTIASVAGQLAGSVAGVAGIPHEHVARIVGGEEITRVPEQFAYFVVANA